MSETQTQTKLNIDTTSDDSGFVNMIPPSPPQVPRRRSSVEFMSPSGTAALRRESFPVSSDEGMTQTTMTDSQKAAQRAAKKMIADAQFARELGEGNTQTNEFDDDDEFVDANDGGLRKSATTNKSSLSIANLIKKSRTHRFISAGAGGYPLKVY